MGLYLPYKGLFWAFLGPDWPVFVGGYSFFLSRKYFLFEKIFPSVREFFLLFLNVTQIRLGATPPDPAQYGPSALVITGGYAPRPPFKPAAGLNLGLKGPNGHILGPSAHHSANISGLWPGIGWVLGPLGLGPGGPYRPGGLGLLSITISY